MQITDANVLSLHFMPGDVIWGCQIPTETQSGIAPVQGILSAYRYEKDSKSADKPYGDCIDYFIPLKADGKTPSWKKAVKAYTMTYATTEDECKNIYNTSLKSMMDMHAKQIKNLASHIIK